MVTAFPCMFINTTGVQYATPYRVLATVLLLPRITMPFAITVSTVTVLPLCRTIG